MSPSVWSRGDTHGQGEQEEGGHLKALAEPSAEPGGSPYLGLWLCRPRLVGCRQGAPEWGEGSSHGDRQESPAALVAADTVVSEGGECGCSLKTTLSAFYQVGKRRCVKEKQL